MTRIKKFVEKVLESKSNKLEKFKLGKLGQVELDMHKEKTGFDLSEYERVIDSYDVKHIFNNHGNSKSEEKRGQIAVTPETFNKISEITSNPDQIQSGLKNTIGNDIIKYSKEMENRYNYFEEKRDGKKELAGKTLYIQKMKKDISQRTND